jgi:exodeoxyribonuclease VII large subunit
MNSNVWTVGALCKAVADALSARFDAVRVRGEISGFTQAGSGHCYFSLKDPQGQLRCAMFRRAAMQMGRLPRNGDQVEVMGRLGVYEARGDLQMIVEAMRPLGQGALYEEFLRLKAKLEQEGLFDPAFKRGLSRSPKRIGLVTSLGAAALHDVATALQRRVPHIGVTLVPALVQGAGAPESLINALQTVYAQDDIDVILLVRGGGSMEDLWAFNDESLVRCVRRSPVPLVCGVGHETDFTLCDFAADLRAPTPTAAAELCAVPQQDWLGALALMADRARDSLSRRLDSEQQHLDRLQQAVARPRSGLSAQSRLLHGLGLRAASAVQAQIGQLQRQPQSLASRWTQAMHRLRIQQTHRLDKCRAQLALLDPHQVLERGYAWLADEQGRALTRAGQFQTGQSVRAVLADGELDLQVQARRLHG